MPTESALRRLSPDDAFALLQRDGGAYIDVRSEAEFEQGHPAGAYNVPLRHQGTNGPVDNAEFLDVMRACFARDTPLVIGCQSGLRSVEAAHLLIEAGFGHVYEQRAGFGGTSDPFGRKLEAGWKVRGLPCALHAQEGRDYAALRIRASLT